MSTPTTLLRALPWLAAAICALPVPPALAQAAAPSPPALDPLRAATLALIDALEKQSQQSRDRQEQAMRQAIQQQRATTLALLEALVAQGLISRERAEAIARLSEPVPEPVVAAAPTVAAPLPPVPAVAAAVPVPGVVRVPYVSETLKAQLREDIRNDVLSVAREERWADPRLLPDWVRSVTLHGDVRVRAQQEHLPESNYPAEGLRSQTTSPAWSPDVTNTTIDRTRMTLRARLALDAKAGDDVEAGLRLSTGTTSGPSSASQTLGSGFNKSSVVLDRAFVKWEPMQDFRLMAGRFGNPFFGGDLIWPDDLGFDGVAVQTERTLTSGAYAFATAGAFPLEEFNVDKNDKWLYGLQMGVDWALGSSTQWRTALAVYDFRRVQGVRETAPPPTGPRAGTVPYFDSQYPSNVRLKGNTLINLNDPTSTAAPTWGLASKFRPVNLTTALTLKHFAPLDVIFGVDWVKNSAFDATDISQRAGVPLGDLLRNRSTGLQAKLGVGKVRLGEKGDWQVTAALRHFERDAWLDGFTDTTWNLGGTNYRGWSLGGQYALDRRAALGLRLTSTRNLDDGYRAPGTGEATKSSAPLRIDVLQIDLNARF